MTFLSRRSAGVLLSIASLPSPYGIGTMGREAFRFLDFLVSAGQRCWQILPLEPPGLGDSPYQTYSAFAGNPLYIDLDFLADAGLLDRRRLQSYAWSQSEDQVRYAQVRAGRNIFLREAWTAARGTLETELEHFRVENRNWLDSYACFMVFRSRFAGLQWMHWPAPAERFSPEDTLSYIFSKPDLRDEFFYQVFLQKLFCDQWTALAQKAREKGITFIGDLPIYVSLDSADVWAHPELFRINADGTPAAVSGVPPDSFSENGQVWNNPLYNWQEMKRQGYSWWIARVRAAGRRCSVLRFDHFRGLSSFWSVPYGEDSARNGHWEPGPGLAFLSSLSEACPHLSFIAEDLGYEDAATRALLQACGWPGMKILEFGFTGERPNDHLPHRYPAECVCYPGTHDNPPIKQWLEEMSPERFHFAKDYMGLSTEEGFIRGVLRTGLSSPARLFIAQMQDWLELGKEARINVPGTVGERNWTWRLHPGQLTEDLQHRMAYLTSLFGR